jgi:2-methylcitrate dehydratase PrpD
MVSPKRMNRVYQRRTAAPTATLAAWIARTPPIRSRRAVALAKDALKDIVACMLAGARDEATLCVSSAARGWGAPAAALVFGTAAHALDYDDNYHPMAGHATAVLAPAIFALAESRSASGAAALDAYIVGLEALALVATASTSCITSAAGIPLPRSGPSVLRPPARG